MDELYTLEKKIKRKYNDEHIIRKFKKKTTPDIKKVMKTYNKKQTYSIWENKSTKLKNNNKIDTTMKGDPRGERRFHLD